MADEVTAPVDAQADTVLAYRRLAMAHLEAAGFENPLETLDGLYRECLPGAAEYEAEAQSFEKDYQEAMRKAAYFRAIEELAGEDAKEFGRLYGFGADEAERRLHGGSRYAELVEQIAPFDPSSAEQYYARFDDHPVEVHERVYGMAFELAKARLMAAGAKPE